MTTTRRAFGALAAGAALATLAPAATANASGRGRLVAHDDFRHGLHQWVTELQDGGRVTASRGVLEVDVPSGATVWFRKRLEGPYVLEYTATPVSEGGVNDRVSDLNNFWNATDVRSPDDLFATPRDGPWTGTTTSRPTTRATAPTTTPRPGCAVTSARPGSGR